MQSYDRGTNSANVDRREKRGPRLVAYMRVSTAKQGQSGLGLAAQRTTVKTFAHRSNQAIVAEFVEVESGGKSDRPQLALALAACRIHRATLVIAKLDRLARNVAFIANLMDGGVDFVACDIPQANRLTLHIMAAMAEYERRAISDRTKAALAAAKMRGAKIGNPNGAAHLLAGCKAAAAASAEARRKKAVLMSLAMKPFFDDLHRQGFVSASSIATRLNKRGIPAVGGGHWHASQVRRVQQRLKEFSEIS
ncbi:MULTISPECIES: recombinase family protein [unclassified Sphingopyxis]|uniref:recombinase family protein n=1 Tax=unclassified Sphingopyxis TaxID=2614943 RepID=UPI00286156F2|nr:MULTISPECIES: recombinase family protein [unclassified Sphingopyxis]MDR6833601.1 DNA invertase Pin-like site-specific DNA recombinase [Sphingopyxis sp. BE122]MDR7225870.1 DNA invertase Pin-like site-specific DNA recombinase [Sphingopyxis sp. BE259]